MRRITHYGIIILVTYLIFSFILGEINSTLWSIKYRLGLVLVSVLIIIMYELILNSFKNNSNEQND